MRGRAHAYVLAVALLAPGCKGKEDGAAKGPANSPPKVNIVTDGLPPRPAAKVTKLVVAAAGKETTLERGKDGWSLVGAARFPADTAAVNGALRELERMELSPEPVATGKDRWEEFHVTPDKVATLTAHMGGSRPFVVHLGQKRHVRIGDDPRVFEAYHVNYFTFVRGRRFWRARQLLSLPLGSVTEVEISAGGATAKAIRDGAEPTAPWKLVSGAKAVGRFAPAAPGMMATRLGTMIAYDVVPKGAVTAKLDQPRAVVTLRTASATYVIRIGASYGDITYLGRDGDNRIFTVKNHAIDWLLAGPKAWSQP